MRPGPVYSWTALLHNALVLVLAGPGGPRGCSNSLLELLTHRAPAPLAKRQAQEPGGPRSCDNSLLELLTHRAAPAKRQDRPRDDQELASVPWQTLWLLEAGKQDCDFQEAVMRMPQDLRTADWLMQRPQNPIGHCPVRFRPHVDPHRWFPRNLVVSECLCEGSPCARHGLHVCVTAFAARYVYSLYTGKKRVLIAVGCICAVQKTRLAKVIAPDTP